MPTYIPSARNFGLVLLLALCASAAQGQFQLSDSLRGALNPQRTCYDVHFYELRLKVEPDKQYISGTNTMHYQLKQGFNMLQIDLFANMQIDSIVHEGKELKYFRKYNAVFVDFGEMQEPETKAYDSIKIHYRGKPTVALNPPWDGGFTWQKDERGKDWIGVACEGIGASLWWPNKDHLSDEPDSFRLRCAVPKGLQCISNGQFRGEYAMPEDGDYREFEWFVSYPINNYNVTLNIADYVHFSDSFLSPSDGEKLALDYYVLPYNLEKAKKQFEQVHPILKAFEEAFDKYPFWRDGYKLVETPYLGMEHQGAIAYGNKYLPGYLGRHPPGIPVDFIILHETGHEWWGNSISCADHAEMWLHESFTTYMELIYVERTMSYADALRYLKFYSGYIANQYPMLGPMDVNFKQRDSDIYYKGSMMLHTLRRSLGDDALWWDILKQFYRERQRSIVATEDFTNYFSKRAQRNYSRVFEQYLRKAKLPILQYKLRRSKRAYELLYRWQADVEGFDLPVYLLDEQGEQYKRLEPSTSTWQSLSLSKKEFAKLRFEYGLYTRKKLDS